MDILFSKNPLIPRQYKCIDDYASECFEKATSLNIATGFITNESIAELKRLVEYRKNEMHLLLFIGMHYLDGFTKLQYQAVKELGFYLNNANIGDVYVSPKVPFHGKMYSFMKGNECLCSFVGSSNLGSFIGTHKNYVESDVYFPQEKGIVVNFGILNIIENLGESIGVAKEITDFKEVDEVLLDEYDGVEKIKNDKLENILLTQTDIVVKLPLKTEPKSNLNTYFGAGKVPNKFSKRDYYEVEIIISRNIQYNELLPTDFMVITEDGYKFQCSRQGDYNKNLRSAKDLKILGKWIKGHMENDGALKIGEPVTDETLEKFGKKYLVFTKCKSNDWILRFE